MPKAIRRDRDIDSSASPARVTVERLFEAYVERVEESDVKRLRRLGRVLGGVATAPKTGDVVR